MCLFLTEEKSAERDSCVIDQRLQRFTIKNVMNLENEFLRHGIVFDNNEKYPKSFGNHRTL